MNTASEKNGRYKRARSSVRKRILLLLGAAVLFLGVSVYNPGRVRPCLKEDVDVAVKANRWSIVSLQAGNRNGSGVVYEISHGQVYIITAAHVLEDAETIFVTFPDGSVADAGSLGSLDPEDVDFALIRLELGQLAWGTRRRLRAVCTSVSRYKDLRQYDRTINCGAATDGSLVAYSGQVGSAGWQADEGGLLLYQYCRADAGMSGGASLDGFGYFQGMILGGNGQESVSLPLPEVQAAYEMIRYAGKQ